jgi:hypothetical protein
MIHRTAFALLCMAFAMAVAGQFRAMFVLWLIGGGLGLLAVAIECVRTR